MNRPNRLRKLEELERRATRGQCPRCGAVFPAPLPGVPESMSYDLATDEELEILVRVFGAMSERNGGPPGEQL